MIVLGLDPGLAIVGYGVIDIEGNRLSYVNHGCVYTTPDMSMPERLDKVYDGVVELIETYKPEVISIEELFFAKNAKTAINVAHARGVMLLACRKKGVKMLEFTPRQVKQAVAGYGAGDKKQIQYMVKVLLNLKEIPKPDDAADGLALAITYAHVAHNSKSCVIK
ncbi:MAG: crossover junction endodeoxyribonuclease RuvC [Clostridia bacterium]|nr:crossover junction endodeoxyribonuclease RuvC [Clostridia bacterium]